MSTGSSAALLVILAPDKVRSTQGDISTAALGSGSPTCLSATKVAAARPVPADSPATATADAATPLSSSPR